jgi:hypothetical protein
MCVTEAVSWQDAVQLTATLVSAGTAVVAVVFAYLTIREARRLRREERRSRLGELVGDFSATLLRVINGAAHERQTTLPVARARLAAAIAAAGEPLPACQRLVRLDREATPEEVQLQMAMATDELAGIDPFGPPAGDGDD